MRYGEVRGVLLFATSLAWGCTGSSRVAESGGAAGAEDARGGTSGGVSTGGASAAAGASGFGGGGAGGPGCGECVAGSGGTAGAGGTAGSAPGGAGGQSSGAGGGGGVADEGGAPSSGGMGGGSAGSSGSPPLGIAELVGSLDGRLIQIPSAGNPMTVDTAATSWVDGTKVPCLNGDLDTGVDHLIGGMPGTRYLATLHLYGIMETRDYGPEVTRESGSVRPMNNADGADPPPFATGIPGSTLPPSRRASYEIHVLDDAMQEVGLYLVNADTADAETERDTYVIDYERTIEVVGGGVVRLRVFEDGCQIMKNCGANAEYPCASDARTIDLSGVSPPIPVAFPDEGGLRQPGLGEPNDHGGQWWLIDVTAIAAQ